MQITSLYRYQNFNNKQVNFQSRKFSKPIKKTLADVIETQPKFSLNKLTGIREGKFGTVCDGSMPLTNFQELFYYDRNNKRELDIYKRGQSTNTAGYAYSYLKTNSENPISTSFVHNCSVMYLYNKIQNTHFLYHIYPKIESENLEYIIRNFMPEGFQTAAIIPGDKTWAYQHKEYLPMVFDLIKKIGTKSAIQVFHNSSKNPEIVGYKGKVYEIPNKEYLRCKRYGNKFRDEGQASFKITNLEEGNTNIHIHYCTTIEELSILKKYFLSKSYDKEICKILQKLIDERINEIRKIQSFTDSKALLNYVKTKGEKYLSSNGEYNHNNNYYSIVKEQMDKLISR